MSSHATDTRRCFLNQQSQGIDSLKVKHRLFSRNLNSRLDRLQLMKSHDNRIS